MKYSGRCRGLRYAPASNPRFLEKAARVAANDHPIEQMHVVAARRVVGLVEAIEKTHSAQA